MVVVGYLVIGLVIGLVVGLLTHRQTGHPLAFLALDTLARSKVGRSRNRTKSRRRRRRSWRNLKGLALPGLQL